MLPDLLVSMMIAFGFTFYCIPKIIKFAEAKKLFDVPDLRKVHATPIPSLGGIGIFIGFMISLMLMGNSSSTPNFQYILLSFLIIFFVGVKDDIMGLSPQKKFFGQLLVSLLLIFKGELLLTNMHGFLGINSLYGVISNLLTIFTIVLIMNAYNLIDGIDGLATTISIITSSVFAWFFYANNDTFYATLGFTFSASLAAFLIFNYSPAKIFMGDTGSMLCGLVNAILVIHFIETANSTTIFSVSSTPALGFGILIMPLLDTLRVFGIRILNGKSPFYPDRNHLHHILLDRGLSHKVITVIIGTAAICFILLTYLALPMGTTYIIFSQITLFFVGVLFLQVTGRNYKSKMQDIKKENPTLTNRIKTVVTIIAKGGKHEYQDK
jgi:UDP-GlcNAc:undecaprenyl-phosphate/decaprenyl-phosphate GlcNAc-1-phosphate transferase